MFDAQRDDPSSTLADLTRGLYSIYTDLVGSQRTSPILPSVSADNISPCVSSRRVSNPASPSQSAGMSPVPSTEHGHPHQSPALSPATGESGDSGSFSPKYATMARLVCSTVGQDAAHATKIPSKRQSTSPAASLPPIVLRPEPVEPPKVSFEDFAICYRRSQHKLAQRKKLETRLHATKLSIGISSRLVRVAAAIQRGLAECLKYDDKLNFVAIYRTFHDILESSDAAFRRHVHRQDPLDEWSQPIDSALDRSPGFFLQLSPQSRTDLLEILQLARTDSQFLFERLCGMSQSQLAALISSAAISDASDLVFPSATRSRNQFSFTKRNASHAAPFIDHALGFERTDPLSSLLFNIFAAPLDSDAPEAYLRLDVWSSVCAKLISHGGSKYYPLIGHILSLWTTSSDWKAKPKFELYLMDTLQAGAFLLEHIDTPSGLSFDAEPPDPLRTDVAEEFFASAVNSLFDLLDDPDAGLPHAVMKFGSAVLGKLDHPETRDRFLEFFFVQWFFSKFLYGALTYPETHGLLLDFHISKDAREKLLGQVGLQAYTQVFSVLRSMSRFSMTRPEIRQHVENMLLRLNSAYVSTEAPIRGNASACLSSVGSEARRNPSVFLMLSATDVVTLLNALFPRTSSPLCSPPATSSGLALHSPVQSQYHLERVGTVFEPGFFRPHVGSFYSRLPANGKTIFSSDMNFLSLPANSLFRNADRIRFELSDMGELDGRATLDHPSSEDWAIFSISETDRTLTWGLFPDTAQENQSEDDIQSTALGIEDNYEALQTAIVKLVEENEHGEPVEYGSPDHDAKFTHRSSLRQRFDRAMSLCHQDSDFIGAHYWWNASRQLLHSSDDALTRSDDDSWILGPMYTSCTRSLNTSKSVAERCEIHFLALDRQMQRLQITVKDLAATITKLRNKMWYMTDVKNSMRYEDAKHVALALKTMIYSARLFKQPQNEPRSRSGTRSLAGSLLQKPEVQVMNVMKAPGSQGGPNKLSDEQVDLTRKWLLHNGIDNFCKGEERIHRFCYEVKTSINRLVGETMAETPVLWASELFQRERTKYEGYSNRRIVSVSSTGSSIRPSSIASEDVHAAQLYGTYPRRSDSVPRIPPDIAPLGRKKSYQSLASDKWRSPIDFSATDTSSVGDSPGKSTSTSTADSCSTFWSAPRTKAQYAGSSSSLFSRPPSMFSDTAAPSRRNDRNAHGKATFLQEMKEALTSLFLSDLGSPVWSCGSETDAWFLNALNRRNIRVQMEKRARVQRFYAEYEERSTRQMTSRTSSNLRRSRSLGPGLVINKVLETPGTEVGSSQLPREEDYQQPFSYQKAFARLMEIFSRHANPFVKLKALRDLRSLAIAALNSPSDDKIPLGIRKESPRESVRRNRASRYSFSGIPAIENREKLNVQSSISPAAESVIFDSRPSEYSFPKEMQIVTFLRDIILELKPKTLFRDLQFISAFVPSEILNKTDSGTAFLQFGLAALSLKDEVCNSMVEIADKIVSQELSRRHHPPHGHDSSTRSGHGIEDAAGMWIITAKEGNPVAQRELAILYLTHPEILPRVTLPLTLPRDTFKAEMMYHRDEDSKSDPQSMCLALHWMQLSANGGDELAKNRLREREEFDSIA